MDSKPLFNEDIKKREIALNKKATEYLIKAGLTDDQIKLLEDFGYFRAPASKGHHLAVPCGLIEHSINVTDWLLKLTESGFVSWSEERSPYLIGMLHDLVKCRCYIETDLGYEYCQTGYVGHGAASALMAMSELGVRLNDMECKCIVHHMGAFGLDAKQLKEYDAALNMCPAEIIATHTADMMAARVSESGIY